MKKIGIIFAIIILTLVLIKGFGEVFYVNNVEIANEKTAQQGTEQSLQAADGEELPPTSVQSDNANTENESKSEMKTDTGTFQGQIDNSFIEIKISGVPDEKALRVFMLSEEIKSSLEQLKLEKGADIKIQYYKNENGQDVITRIEKLSSAAVN